MRANLLTSFSTLLTTVVISTHAAPTNPAAAQLAHLPVAVRKTILETKGNGKLEEVDKKTEDGELVYSVKVLKDGKQEKFTVSTDGAISQRAVTLEQVPAAVRKQIKDRTIDAKLGDIVRVSDNGDVTFEVQITQGKRDRDFALDEDGMLVSEQVFIEELTVAVQKTIREKALGAELGDITRTFEEGDPAYEVNMTKAGQERYFAVDGDGTLLGEQVFLTELTAAVQSTIQAQATEATLGDINKIYGDEVTYEAAMKKHGTERTFTVDADGDLLDIQMPLAETPAAVQKTIREQAKGSKLDLITKLIDGTEINYQVDYTSTNNQDHTFYVTDKGDLLGLEIGLEEAPAEVQKTLQTAASGGSIEKVIKNVADGEVTYQADMSVGGKARTAIVDVDGKVTYEQAAVELKDAPEAVQKSAQTKMGAGKLSNLTKTTEDGVVSYEVEWIDGEKHLAATLDEKGEDVALDGK